MTFRLGFVSLLLLLVLAPFISSQSPVVLAEPNFQGPAPTEEPTKAPYVFPTPIFIPTFTSAGPAGATPAPTRAAVPVDSTGERTYTVEPGDSPWVIAQKMYGSGPKYGVILSANGLTESSKLKVGMVLKIPATDASGQPLPFAAPTVAPTTAPEPPLAAPTSAFAPTTPAATPTRAPTSNSIIPSSIAGALGIILNLLTFLFFAGAILAGILSYMVYRRSKRLAEIATFARRLRLR